MTIDYTKVAAGATRALKSAGAPVTLRVVALGPRDPLTGEVPATPTDHVGTGALIGYRLQDVDGTRVLQGDQQLYLSVTKADGSAMPVPTTRDQVLIGAALWRIVSVQPVAPAGAAVLYILQLRS